MKTRTKITAGIGAVATLAGVLLLSSPYSCETAKAHVHADIAEQNVAVTSWNSCELKGTVAGESVSFFGLYTAYDGEPRDVTVRYCRTCGQIMWVRIP